MNNLIYRCSQQLLLIGLIVAGSLSVANFALARGGHGEGGGMHLRMLWDLDLSTEQKAAIGRLLPAYREEKEALREKRQAAREAMRSLMTAETLDENAIREASRAMAPIMEDMAVLRARFVYDLKDILSPEQVQRLQERREGARDRRSKHRQFRQEMTDTWLQMPAHSSTDAPATGQ